jgi:hypothetical protein
MHYLYALPEKLTRTVWQLFYGTVYFILWTRSALAFQ